MYGFENADSWNLTNQVSESMTREECQKLKSDIQKVCASHNDLLKLVKTLHRAINSVAAYGS